MEAPIKEFIFVLTKELSFHRSEDLGLEHPGYQVRPGMVSETGRFVGRSWLRLEDLVHLAAHFHLVHQDFGIGRN